MGRELTEAHNISLYPSQWRVINRVAQDLVKRGMIRYPNRSAAMRVVVDAFEAVAELGGVEPVGVAEVCDRS